MNGATEATLAELLAEAKAMNANLVTLTRLSNSANNALGSSANNASRNVNNLSNSAQSASRNLDILATAGNLISGVFQTIGSLIGGLVGGITATVKGLYNFSLKAAEGTARLSDFYDSFRNLPFGIGMLMGILADFQRQTEKLLDVYRNITTAGAAFNGNLALLRTAATRGSLTLDEFARVTRSNSEIFSTMGGNVDAGVMKFTEAQNRLMNRYGGQLLGLGLTAEGAANMLGIFMNNAGRLDRQEMQNSDVVAQGVLNMTMQMDAYSKLTGKNREQLEAEMKKKSFDAAWKTFTAGMGPEQAASALAAIELAIAKGGEGAGDMVKQMFMTGGAITTPMTEGAQQFMVQTQGAGEEFVRTFHDSVLNMQAGSREQLTTQMEAVRRLGIAYNDFIGPMGNMGAVLSIQGNKFVNNTALMNTALVDARRTEAEQRKAIDEVLKQQAAQGKGTAKSAAEAELAVRNFGLNLNNIINSALAPFIEIAQKFSTSFLNYLIPVATSLANWLGTQLTAIKQAYGEGGFTAAFQQILKSLGDGVDTVIAKFKPTWDAIKPQVLGAMESTWNFVKPYLAKAFDGLVEFIKPYFMRGVQYLFDEMKGYLYDITGGRFGTDKNRSAMTREFDFQQALIDSIKRGAGGNALTASDIAGISKAKEIQQRLIDEEKRYIGMSKEQKSNYQMPEIRHGGTIGMTGSWWEKESATLNVQAGESVVTQDQMRQIVDTASQSGLADAINRLNNMTAELIKATKQVAANTAATVDATKSLSGNLWAT
jgi:hypothetical protein